jgi:hypothetical protein
MKPVAISPSITTLLLLTAALLQSSPLLAQPKRVQIDVPLRCQQTPMWCWAAVTEMVLEALGAPRAAIRHCDQQSSFEMSSKEPTTYTCDCEAGQIIRKGKVVPGWPDFAKFEYGCQRTQRLRFSELTDEIAHGRPVAFAWSYGGSGGHIMVARGTYEDRARNLQLVLVNDPSPRCDSQCEGGRICVMSYAYYDQASYGVPHAHWYDFYGIEKAGPGARCDLPQDPTGASGPRKAVAEERPVEADSKRAASWIADYLEVLGVEGRSALKAPAASTAADALEFDGEPLPIRVVFANEIDGLKTGGRAWQRSPDGYLYKVETDAGGRLVAEEYFELGRGQKGIVCSSKDKQAIIERGQKLNKEGGAFLTSQVEHVIVPELNLDMLSFEVNHERRFILLTPFSGLNSDKWSNPRGTPLDDSDLSKLKEAASNLRLGPT